jgi:hypothetical protein
MEIDLLGEKVSRSYQKRRIRINVFRRISLMFKLSESDVNKLIIACNKVLMSSSDIGSRREYNYLVDKLKTYKEQNFNRT